jgi:hypothetical protein
VLDFLVLGRNQEARAVGPNALVGLERCLDRMATLGVGTLADERGLLEADLLGRARDPLVDVTERRLRLGNA